MLHAYSFINIFSQRRNIKTYHCKITNIKTIIEQNTLGKKRLSKVFKPD